jgi:hypothetical protein
VPCQIRCRSRTHLPYRYCFAFNTFVVLRKRYARTRRASGPKSTFGRSNPESLLNVPATATRPERGAAALAFPCTAARSLLTARSQRGVVDLVPTRNASRARTSVYIRTFLGTRELRPRPVTPLTLVDGARRTLSGLVTTGHPAPVAPPRDSTQQSPEISEPQPSFSVSPSKNRQ